MKSRLFPLLCVVGLLAVAAGVGFWLYTPAADDAPAARTTDPVPLTPSTPPASDDPAKPWYAPYLDENKSGIVTGYKEPVVNPAGSAKTYDIPGGKCTLYADCPTGRLSVATIAQDGRYPETGQRINATCTEAILVLEGELTVTLDKKPVTLKPGDLVYITPKTPYSVEGKGKAVVMIEPKWDKTQNTPAPAK